MKDVFGRTIGADEEFGLIEYGDLEALEIQAAGLKWSNGVAGARTPSDLFREIQAPDDKKLHVGRA